MNKIVLLIFLGIIYFNLSGQILENKLNIYLGYEIGQFPGKAFVNDANFISPSLFSNYKDVSGISFKGMIRSCQYISPGISLNYMRASNWETTQYEDYKDSKFSIFSFSPVIQIHNKYSESGFSNRFRIFVEFGPTIGITKLFLKYPIFYIENENDAVEGPLKRSDFFYGLKAGFGMELILNQAFGIYFENSVNRNWVSSKLYNDRHFTGFHLGLGLIVRLRKDKRFY